MAEQQPSSNFREFQTMAAYIATHPRLHEVVEALEADANADKTLFNEANKDPKKHLNDRGFDLPEGWTVQITHDSPIALLLCVGASGTADHHCVHFEFHVSTGTVHPTPA